MYLTQSVQLLPLLLFFSCSSLASIAPSPVEAPYASPPLPPTQNVTIEYMDPTFPPHLPTQDPKCSLLVLHQDFSGQSPLAVGTYTPPPECPAPWSRVILDLAASVSDLQKDRIAAIWLDGAEILRTTTPLPMTPSVSWHVRKDITRYTALLHGTNGRSSRFSMMVENSNETFPGVFSINVTLHFYRGAVSEDMTDGRKELSLRKYGDHISPFSADKVDSESSILNARPTIRGLYSEPANLILPLSRTCNDAGDGFWLKVTNESDIQTKKIVIPRNTYRAVLEIYVSHHKDDEYWYGNPLRTTSLGGDVGQRYGLTKMNGGFRQVVAFIDRKYVGSVVPFPVIYPSSINPYFWVPVAAIGAYNHPSYDLDITPFVGQLVDGQAHEFGLTVSESQPYWLVDANLHLWLDPWSDQTEGGLIRYKVPPLKMQREADWGKLDGKSDVEGQATVRFSGWVSSSEGNTTTSVRHKYKFKSHIEVEDKGNMKNVEVESEAKTSIRIERDHEVVGRVAVETNNPLHMTTMSLNNIGGSEIHKAKLFHAMKETRSMTAGKRETFITITDRQQSLGSLLIEDGVIVSGIGDTRSTYKYRDEKTCYLRKVNMIEGKVREDEETASCFAFSDY